MMNKQCTCPTAKDGETITICQYCSDVLAKESQKLCKHCNGEGKYRNNYTNANGQYVVHKCVCECVSGKLCNKHPQSSQEIQCAHCGGLPHEDITSCKALSSQAKDLSENESGVYKEADSVEEEFDKEFRNHGFIPESREQFLAFIKKVQQKEREKAIEVITNLVSGKINFKEAINKFKND